MAKFDVPLISIFSSILNVSRSNNMKNDITGVLIFDSIYFIQILEGQRHLVWSTFQKIQTDDRHFDVQLVEFAACGRRQFTNWSMAGSLRTSIQDDIYTKHGYDGRIRPNELTVDRLIPLVREIIALSPLGTARDEK